MTGNAQRLSRTGGLTMVALLAACNAAGEPQVEGRESIACLLPGASSFKMLCAIDRMMTPDGVVLTVRAPDGAFRRLLIVNDGRGVTPADGAEPIAVRPAGSSGIEVAAGDIVYRLPAEIRP